MNKKFIVTGANFTNKGAQAMLFITVHELRNRFPGCEITMTTWEKLGKLPYSFDYVSENLLLDLMLEKDSLLRRLKRNVRSVIHLDTEMLKCMRIINHISSVTAMIDISGYMLSSQWGINASKAFLKRIKCARLYQIPFFIMPQSIGPFEYGKEQTEMDQCILENLAYTSVIYPRESSGYDILMNDYHLNNIRKSVDLVLQNREIDLKNISTAPIAIRIPQIPDGHNVAIVPNVRNLDHCGNHDELMRLYQEIIADLSEKGREIYLLRHSKEDVRVCEEIYAAIEDKKHLHLLIDDMNCFEFNEIIKKFDYIVASRYHAIVHAYKNGVPALVLGWAEKYHELVAMFGQKEYIFDVRSMESANQVKCALNKLDACWKEEKLSIIDELKKCQNDNCFDVLIDYLG